ncbi:hypothetical protein ACFL0T_05940 [Candidatus Omnitrophota bacterium]
MEGIGKILAVLGVLMAIYTILGRFLGGPTIGLGIITLQASTGLLVAILLITMAILFQISK